MLQFKDLVLTAEDNTSSLVGSHPSISSRKQIR